jgi:hypothetical protein
MIKLIDLIKEAKQVGTLYHFTSYSKLVKIINSGFVLTTEHKDIQPYVSFTRDKLMYSDSISTQVRLTIDGNGLSNRYKIMPHADVKAGYGRGSVDEMEERISLIKYPQGVNISRYLTIVDIKKINENFDLDDPDSFQDTEDFIEPPSFEDYNKAIKLLKSKNIPYKIVEKY